MGFKCDFFGIFCFLFLYLLIGYTDYVCVFQILAIDQEQLLSFYILAAGYQVVLFLLIWSHLMCLCSDPGTVDLTLELRRKQQQQITADGSSPAACSSPCGDVEYILPSSINHSSKIYHHHQNSPDTSSSSGGGSGGSGSITGVAMMQNNANHHHHHQQNPNSSSPSNSSSIMNIVREVQSMRPHHQQQQQQVQVQVQGLPPLNNRPPPPPPPLSFPRPAPLSLPPPRSYIGEFEWTFCRFCAVYRPPRAHHCHICRRCILLRDHHCPWINNCVGEYNQKYFLQFTSYACLGSLYTLACIIISCLYSSVPSPPMKISIHVALLVLAAVIFGIFSVAVLCDQVTGIFNDQTNHERYLKHGGGGGDDGSRGAKRGRLRALRSTCGYISVFLWLLPLPLGGSAGGGGGGGIGGGGGHQEAKSMLHRPSKDVEPVGAAAAATSELWRRDQLYAL